MNSLCRLPRARLVVVYLLMGLQPISMIIHIAPT